MATGWRSSYYRYKDLFLNVSSLTRKERTCVPFLEIVLSIIAVIIFVMFALKPTALTIISLVQQIKEEKETLSVLTQKVEDLQKAGTLLAQNQNYINDIDTAVASAPSPDVFTKQVQGLAARNGIEIIGLAINKVVLVGTPETTRVSEETDPLPENANEMAYSTSVRGSFANINSFLKNFENLRVTSAIDSVAISSFTTDTGRVIVAVISGRVPYMGNDK